MGRDVRGAVHEKNPPALGYGWGGDVMMARRGHAERAPPGDREVRGRLHMLHRLAEQSPRQRPFALGRRWRQKEVLALEGIGDLELVIQRDHRNAHAFRGGACGPPAMERGGW